MEKYQESAKHFYRQALNLCLAMIAQQLILNLITIIDNVMVGRYGDLFVSCLLYTSIQQSPLLDDFLLFFQAGKGMNKQRQTLTRF